MNTQNLGNASGKRTNRCSLNASDLVVTAVSKTWCNSIIIFIKWLFKLSKKNPDVDILFCTFSVAQDLFEQIPKKTCFPMRTEKFEMLTSAQFACANDPTCSGLVESPKRRGQQKKTMYGNYSLTEREYLLCDYPQSTKNTSDTLLFKKRGT